MILIRNLSSTAHRFRHSRELEYSTSLNSLRGSRRFRFYPSRRWSSSGEQRATKCIFEIPGANIKTASGFPHILVLSYPATLGLNHSGSFRRMGRWSGFPYEGDLMLRIFSRRRYWDRISGAAIWARSNVFMLFNLFKSVDELYLSRGYISYTSMQTFTTKYRQGRMWSPEGKVVCSICFVDR